MKILIACEYSGITSEAFAAKGHDVVSCDLLPGENDLFYPQAKRRHVQGDVLQLLDDGFDLMIGHPPCTYLSWVGNRHWWKEGRPEKRELAIEFFKKLWDAPIEKICLENPLGVMDKELRRYDQIINPYQFGDPIAKRTCLWLKGLPLLVPTNEIMPIRRVYHESGKKRSGIHILSKSWSADSSKKRSVSFRGIAQAMADQWG
jgi:hypothetical protein